MASPLPRLLAVPNCSTRAEGPILPRVGDRISEGLDSVPEFAYKGTSRARDEEWRCGNQRGSKRDKSH
ncbi:hypothetical protein M405DRAFT_833719 [Rhizopogon salebrosus TDB-379]|nr:hypothetical protein M405DRAFT_833719 [Rhizopogon salebrosus TDB-379]